MIEKKTYIKEIIKKLKNNNSFSINKEKERLINLFLSNKLELESKNESIYLNPEILSDLDELEHQIKENRYATGSYYTNKKLINNILKETNYYQKTVLDPAAGTGNFLISILLNLEEKFKNQKEFIFYISNYVFFNEIKESSLNIYLIRLNLLSIKFFNKEISKKDMSIIKKNCFNKDFLVDFSNPKKFDIIIGNPPYLGTKSLGKPYLKKIKDIFGFTDDLYSLFVFKSLDFLKPDGFLSFITSSTYLTLDSKKRLRNKLIENNLYKIIKNNKNHFNIKTNTATFFINKNYEYKNIGLYFEDDNGKIIKEGELKRNLNINFSCFSNEQSNLFKKVEALYNQFKKEVHTTKSFEKFINSEYFIEIIKNNQYLPLGLIAYIATGVDFKGENKRTLFSVEQSNKYNLLIDQENIEYEPKKEDFINGLENKKYIPAIKGKEHLFVLWNNKHVNFLKEIKAPLRNIRLYGDFDKIYCKTSDYYFTKVNKHTLCINTAGACFIIPVINISLDNILNQINNASTKDYIKENINNSLCLTTNNLKLIPIKIR